MKKFANACVRVMNRWLPDPFLFAIILTIVVFIAAMIGTGMGPIRMIWAWGGEGGTALGMWNLLAFSMQMALVLVLGSALASAKICKKILSAIAGLAKDKKSGIIVVCVVSTICCWLNWGFGLIVGALIAKEVVKRVRDLDYPLIIAAAYAGFVVWHAGLSGSIPLALGGNGYTIATTGQTFVAQAGETMLHPVNLVMCLLVLVGLPVLFITMHPDKDNAVLVNPEVLAEEKEREYTVNTPAEKVEHSKILWAIVCIMFFIYIVWFFVTKKTFVLDLNIVNCIFLFLGILAHGDLRKYVDAIGDAASSSAGILLQFPFYAGIMGLMTVKNDAGVCLAGIISDFFVLISNKVTFPVWTFLSAGVVNFFVPSGGGQWAVQGPIVMPASAELGVEAGRAAMAIAWGDQWTNMIQPFWALPALGVAGLKAKDIMGYLVAVLLFTGIVAVLGFLVWGLIA